MEPVVYLNGELIAENEARISIFDIGFMYSAVFMEALRTFKHKLYRLEDHLERLDRSMRYAGLESFVTKQEMARVIYEVLDANIGQFDKDDDCWVCAQVTPGQGFPQPLMKHKISKPTVISYVSPLPYDEYAQCYKEGKRALISTVRNLPPSVVDPRAKTRFRLHYFLAKREAAVQDPSAFALLLDINGYVTEGTGANIFVAMNGQLHTPTTANILEGISRRTVIELASQLGIRVVERNLTSYDLLNADEGFWTTSSYCMLPLSQVNGTPIGNRVPGPITSALLSAWSEQVGVDIVAQAFKFANRKTNIWRQPAPTKA